MKEKTFYHESHKPKTKRIDTRIPEALKYRKQAELSQEEKELDEVANDMLEEENQC